MIEQYQIIQNDNVRNKKKNIMDDQSRPTNALIGITLDPVTDAVETDSLMVSALGIHNGFQNQNSEQIDKVVT